MTKLEARVIAGVAVAAMAGLGTFGYLAWRTVAVEHIEPDAALRRFDEARSTFAGAEPILRLDEAGSVHRSDPPEPKRATPTHFHVWAYRFSQNRLIRADLPFWFLKVKGPAVQYAVRDTGLDLDRLGVTAGDLERYGGCLVLDETRSNGDRLLVWTE